MISFNSNGKSIIPNQAEINPGCSSVFVTRTSASTQVELLVVRSVNGSSYDVYVTTQAANPETKVSGYFPFNQVTYENDFVSVALSQNTSYTFIQANDPTNFIDCTSPSGTPLKYSCPCCSGNGNCSLVNEILGNKWSCEPGSCAAPGDNTVTCELKSSSGVKGGGILLNVASANITIHIM